MATHCRLLKLPIPVTSTPRRKWHRWPLQQARARVDVDI